MKKQQNRAYHPINKITTFFISIIAIACIGGGLLIYGQHSNVLGVQTASTKTPWDALIGPSSPIGKLLISTPTATIVKPQYSCNPSLNLECPRGFACTEQELTATVPSSKTSTMPVFNPSQYHCVQKGAAIGEGCGGKNKIACQGSAQCIDLKIGNNKAGIKITDFFKANTYSGVCMSASAISGCEHKGLVYNENAKFMDACDLCTCKSGKAVCTKTACAPSPSSSAPTPKSSPVSVRYCTADKDCYDPAMYCYQPPMPVCPVGMMCAQVMPQKYCRAK